MTLLYTFLQPDVSTRGGGVAYDGLGEVRIILDHILDESKRKKAQSKGDKAD